MHLLPEIEEAGDCLMGAGSAGNFGKTKGSVDLKSFLDTLSGLLAIASLIPVADTAIDIAALLVDLLRGDYVSAALDLAGVIPFVGEAADTARIAKVTDKTIDAVKTAKKVDKAVDTAKVADKTSDAVKSAVKVPKLYKSQSKLVKNGWKEITPAAMEKNTTSRMFKKNGYTIRFDKGTKGMGGYGGKDHYHILNPNSTGKHDYYLDKFGNPVPKNSKKSHIIP